MPFKGRWRQHPIPSVFALGIVEHLDVVEDVRSSAFSGFVCSATDAFAFKQVEEALGYRIVVAIPATAHAVFQIVMFEKRRPIDAGEL